MIIPANLKNMSKIAIERFIHANWSTIRARAVRKGATRCAHARLPQRLKVLGASVKTESSKGKKVLTGVAYLSPATESGYDTCHNASDECREACLVKSGQLGMTPALNSRLWKTALALGAPRLFRALVERETESLRKRAEKEGYTPAVRLDGTSDLGLGAVYARGSGVMHYDYTKSAERALRYARGEYAPNYHVTFSFSGHNLAESLNVLRAGGNVAVAFDALPGIKGRREAEPLPATWQGYPVIDGDYLNGDARFLDPRGVVVGLRLKAPEGKRDEIAAAAGAFLQSAQQNSRGRSLPVA